MNQTINPSFAEELSSLVDGEADPATAVNVSAHWRGDAELRARWHRYHLIGDVMRSSELAGSGRDAAFLAALRSRLAEEPVVLAPSAPLQAQPGVDLAAASAGAGMTPGASPRAVRPSSALKRWAPPLALAAGFLVVAIGSASLLRLGSSVEGPEMAQAAQAPSAVPVGSVSVVSVGTGPALVAATSSSVQPPFAGAPVSAPVASLAPEQATGTMIRDARLDGYLAAHKQFGGTSALGVPSGFLRNATHDLHEGVAVPGERP